MRELAAEAEYAGSQAWGSLPATEAHNSAVVLIVGADDLARTTCRLLEPGRPPVFAHLVLARAALEHAGRAWWLLEPLIDLRRRIARGRNEALNSWNEQKRLPDPDISERARTRIKDILSKGEKLGIPKLAGKKGRPAWLLEERPSSTLLIKKLLDVPGEPGLGATVYNYYSAVTHGTTYGLVQSLDKAEAQASLTPGVKSVPLVTRSSGVCSILTSLILGVGSACERRNKLFGWTSEDWNSARLNALEASRKALLG